MAQLDFCFTYYDTDASRDKAHMNRLERGAYDDIISAQRKFGRLELKLITKVLGNDFESCWYALELILKFDGERYFIEWLENSIAKSKEYSKKQSERRTSKTKTTAVEPKENQTTTVENLLEDEDEIEKKKIKYKKLTIKIPFTENQAFEYLWAKWKRYKHEQHKFQYKSILAEQAAIDSLFKITGDTIENANEVLCLAIEKGWKGFHELKNKSDERIGRNNKDDIKNFLNN